MVEVSGFECPGCKTSCDVNRVQHRNSPQQGSPQQGSPQQGSPQPNSP